jgi:hypothetical protein
MPRVPAAIRPAAAGRDDLSAVGDGASKPGGGAGGPVAAVVWDGRNGQGQQVANGVYFYELKAGDFHGTRKMMLTK